MVVLDVLADRHQLLELAASGGQFDHDVAIGKARRQEVRHVGVRPARGQHQDQVEMLDALLPHQRFEQRRDRHVVALAVDDDAQAHRVGQGAIAQQRRGQFARQLVRTFAAHPRGHRPHRQRQGPRHGGFASGAGACRARNVEHRRDALPRSGLQTRPASRRAAAATPTTNGRGDRHRPPPSRRPRVAADKPGGSGSINADSVGIESAGKWRACPGGLSPVANPATACGDRLGHVSVPIGARASPPPAGTRR